MPYMMDYLEKQLAPFEELEFNILDATALAQISMIHAIDTMPPLQDAPKEKGLRALFKPHHDLGIHFIDMLRAEYFPTMFGNLLSSSKAKNDLYGLAASPRFREMRALNYQSVFDTNKEVQFGAMTFVYKNLFTCVAFRGTDASITGWREDFNMAFEMPVPAQDLAVQYLQAVASQRHLPSTLYIVGHSKGGNLAEYAALKCGKKIQKRIAAIYNLDGPGFKPDTFTNKDYKPLKNTLHKVVPEESMVGIMLRSEAPTRVAMSNAKGFDQHSAFTWQINDELTDYVYLPQLPAATQELATTLHEWLSSYDDASREQIVGAFFDAIEISGAQNPVEILNGGTKGLKMLFDASRKLDKPERTTLINAARSFVKVLSQNATGSLGVAASAINAIVDKLPKG